MMGVRFQQAFCNPGHHHFVHPGGKKERSQIVKVEGKMCAKS
jgi:hypothetical protein